MFGRKKSETVEPEPVIEDRPGAKNRPTPKRREAEAANKRPLVPDDRKAAAKRNRAHARQARQKQREALLSGDESGLGPRDAGPHRRFVRDVVDARWNIGEWYLILAMVAVLLVLVPGLIGLDLQSSATLQWWSTLVLWGTLLICAVDGWILTRLIKRRLRDRFGADIVLRGLMSYGLLRAFQIRRWRLPRPAVARGQQPRR